MIECVADMRTYSVGSKMEKFIDMHSHILYGLDDGARDLETSMRMLRIAAKDGISEIILTPHNKPGHRRYAPLSMAERIEKLEACLLEENLAMKLYLGSELYYRSELPKEIEDGNASVLAGSRYVLMEFNPLDDYDYIRNGVYSILMNGYCPILAHVERYQNVCAKKCGITDLIEMGCFMQMNAGSIMGRFGMRVKILSNKLLKQHLVHFVATDAHDTDKRAPYLADCAGYIKRKYGESYTKALFYDNPACILSNETIAASSM